MVGKMLPRVKKDMEREQLNFSLQHVAEEEIIALRQAVEELAPVELIQKPVAQTLLVPVRDPINNGRFISGEVLVTSAIVKVGEFKGWAMVMDDTPERAVAGAVLDAAFAAGICKKEITALARKGRSLLEEEHSRLNARVQSTRVAFDLL